ncbi:MAG: hypothetical protein GX455_11060 [Phycisphaerae bacterium]|nr:hypothetical protein [Phycisphaerae bacterium]
MKPLACLWVGVFCIFSSHLYAATYGGGNGTAENPYRITSRADFLALAADTANYDKCFILTADIDLAGETFTTAVIAPDTDVTDGFQGTPFTGVFDGSGHILDHLTIFADGNFTGLFGEVRSGGQIRNLDLNNVDIRNGGYYVGGLVAHLYDGTLRSCHVSGSVGGMGFVGGLVGSSFFGAIDFCHADCSVTGLSSHVGGLIGYNYDGTIQSCYAAGTTYGNGTYVGGLAGRNDSTITSCYATGAVAGNYYFVGGLVGANWGLIDSCFATGSVSGMGYIGGLVGGVDYGIHATTRSCFWDQETSGTSDGVGDIDPDPEGCLGKISAQMKIRSTFTDVSWDFVGESANGTADVWRMCADSVDYPRLSWEFSSVGDFDCPDGVAMDDLFYLASRWCATTPETVGASDANGDGKTDLADLAILAAHWLK